LLSGRGAVVSFARAGLASFLLALAGFLDVGVALPPLAPSLALGAPFLWLAAFVEVAFSGATWAPCSVTAAALSFVSAFVMVVLVILFCACFAHDDSSLGFAGKAREK
jgi:hypothetical protein